VAIGWPGGERELHLRRPHPRVALALTKTRLAPDFDTTRSVSAILADELGGIG
jgi:hypothetical protein